MTSFKWILPLWKQVLEIETEIIQHYSSSIGSMYGCDIYLGLEPLPKVEFNLPIRNDFLNNQPAFKNLDIGGIQFLRNLLRKEDRIPTVKDWAETLMRYLEIYQTSLGKKSLDKFGAQHTRRIAMLELAAFMMDCHFAWNDLRFFNISLKLMDNKWLYSINPRTKIKPGLVESFDKNLLQIRLAVMKEAGILRLRGTSLNA